MIDLSQPVESRLQAEATKAGVSPTEADAPSVTEDSKLATQSEGVKFLRAEDGVAVYEVGASTYAFRAALNK